MIKRRLIYRLDQIWFVFYIIGVVSLCGIMAMLEKLGFVKFADWVWWKIQKTRRTK